MTSTVNSAMSLADVLDRSRRVAYFTTEKPTADVVENADGTAQVKGLTIFKSGTFRDSMGDEHTWTPDHLSLMAAHYDLLKSGNIFPNVPVRADHSFSVTKVAGYVDALHADSQYLYCDFTFTEPTHYDAYKRGTYRSRSAEIGMYETNDNAMYFPVVWGFAFVDIPAAEGLHSSPQKYVCFDKEIPHVTTPTTFRVNGADTTDVGAVQVHIDALEKASKPEPAKFSVNGAETSDAVAVQTHIADIERQLADHAAKRPVSFRVNGAESADATAVQAHIDVLETFRTASRKSARKGFVDGLFAAGKVAKSEGAEESTLAFVESLDDAQFAAYSKTWDNAPKLSLFEQHGAGNSDPNANGGTRTDRQKIEDEIEICENVLAAHRRSNMDEKQIENTQNFKKLTALRAQISK